MSFPFAAPAVAAGPINPIESVFLSLNSNPYFIGLFMVLLNLGGKYLSIGVTPQQDKIFQMPWFKPLLFFTVLFVATRNFFAALWMGLGVYVLLDFLLNEKSRYYILGQKQLSVYGGDEPVTGEPTVGSPFTPEENEIYNRLDAKMKKHRESTAAANPKKKENPSLEGYYQSTMSVIQGSAL